MYMYIDIDVEEGNIEMGLDIVELKKFYRRFIKFENDKITP